RQSEPWLQAGDWRWWTDDDGNLNRPSVEIAADRGHGQLAMLDSLDADQAVCECAHLPPRPFDGNHFQAMVMVQMQMHGGQDQLVMIVLDCGQLLGQGAYMMIEHQRDRAHDFRLVIPAIADQLVADQIADRFRAGLVATPGAQLVELPEQTLVHGNSKTYGLGHEPVIQPFKPAATIPRWRLSGLTLSPLFSITYKPKRDT